MSESCLPADVEKLVYGVVDQESIVAITDKRGLIVHANDRFCEISGYSRAELLGRNHRILKSGIHKPEFYHHLWSTILSGNTWHGEICNKARDGHLYWVATTITPLRVEGLITHFLALRTDISSRKRVEEALLETHQRQETERRMAALGSLADGVLHDLNNILTGMLGMASEGNSELRNAMLRRALDQMINLTRMLRDYSTGRPTEPSRFLVNPLILCVVSLVRFHKAAPKSLRIETDLDQSKQTELIGVEAHLFEILLNLGVNAVEALSTHEAPVLGFETRLAADRLSITIRDNGPGIPAERRGGLFNPHSSAKGPGRGVGLSVAQRLAQELKGDLRLDPPGEAGTSFTLSLPAIQPTEESSDVILACDDDAVVRRMIQNSAGRLGLRTEFSPDMEALLDSSRRLCIPPAAIVLDSCNEDPDTGDVAKLRQIAPKVPLILVSARLASKGCVNTPHGAVYSLPKPFNLEDLLHALRRSLQRGA